MQYMLLIYDDEQKWAKLPEADQGRIMKEFRDFTESIVKSGNYRAGDQLQPASSATCVRWKGSRSMVTDGPFAEAREQLGGYYLIEARDLNDAIQVAAKIPSARLGCVEVRPIMEFPQE